MTPALLVALGVASQLLGVIVAFVGFRKTWHAFAAGEQFRDPYVARARAMGRAIAARVRPILRRLLRRRPPTQALAGTSIGSAETFGKLSVRVGWGPLPEPSDAALAELHRRTLDLARTQADATQRLEDAVEVMHNEVVALTGRMDEAVKRLEVLNRQVAIGGLHWEASGLFLVLVGLALQGIALAIGSAS